MNIFTRILLFLLLLVPSAYYGWTNSQIPEFGKQHDDGLLFVSAKSLATGQGFRILSLPERPAQTKYPVLYPLYLSLIWRLNPNFPDNLRLASAFSWPLLALALALSWFYWKAEAISEVRAWIMVGALAISPYMILFGCNLFSEMFFLCWILAVFLIGRKEGTAMAALAGIFAGGAYLSRTAGIALLISMPAYYLWRRHPRRALAFAAGMLPCVLGWALWSGFVKTHTSSPTLLYYVDYIGFQFLNVDRTNFAIVLWKNIDALLVSFGSAILPQVLALLPIKILTQVIAIAMISGIVRLARRGIAIPYAFFALVSSGMLIVWHYPPTERFVVPLFPLLLAGLAVELDHLVQMLRSAFRHKDPGQRVVAGVFALFLMAIFGGAVALELIVTFESMPEEAHAEIVKRSETAVAAAWIARNLPPGAGVFSNDDPVLYLYSGHPGNFAPLLTRWWYANDHTKMVSFYKDIVPYCRGRNLQYILATPSDMSRWSGGEDEPAVAAALSHNPQLEPVYQNSSGTILYRIKQ